MPKQDVLDPTPHSTAAATATRSDDVVAERLGNLMLWLIPALAFLAALLR